MTMRHSTLVWSVIILLVLGFWIAYAPSALAHDGPPRLILNKFQFAPGEVLELSGANLGTDLALTVELMANNRVVTLGEAICDGHGDFTQTFVLPADLPVDAYTVRALDTSVSGVQLVLASAPLRISDEAWSSQSETQEFGSAGIARSAPLIGGSALIALGLLAVSLFIALSVCWHRGRAANRLGLRPVAQQAADQQPGSHGE